MVTAVGTLAASNTAVVRVQTSGVLQALHFKEGQTVRAGQVLAQIDPRPAQIVLAQAEGNLARDKAQLDNARVDLQRYQDLLGKDAASRQQVDTQAALVRQLEGTVKTDLAAVDNAKLQLTYTQVLSPITGRAGIKQVDIGNVVQASDANGVVTITQTRPMALLFALPSVHVPKVQAALHGGRPLAVEVWSRDGQTRLANGRVTITDNAIDTSTDTLKLKAELPNGDDALFPNQTVEARLQVDTVAQALTVPVAGVQTGAKGAYLYVVGEDGAVQVRPVKPGPVEGDRMAVEGELKVGEQVVINGIDRLRDGAKVTIERPDAAPGKSARETKDGAAKAPAAQGAAAPVNGAPTASDAGSERPAGWIGCRRRWWNASSK